MKNQNTLLSHIELNVSDYAKSIRFYDQVLIPLGWKRLVCQKTHTVFSDGQMKIVLGPVEEKYRTPEFHRKRVGLNHLAFYAPTQAFVDEYVKTILKPKNIKCLYENHSKGDETYYSIFFEDPDRLKIEVVYSPEYCCSHHWTNKIQSDFEPYSETL